ncbi:hypothetical protein D3C85_1576360 [compost metagenome]
MVARLEVERGHDVHILAPRHVAGQRWQRHDGQVEVVLHLGIGCMGHRQALAHDGRPGGDARQQVRFGIVAGRRVLQAQRRDRQHVTLLRREQPRRGRLYGQQAGIFHVHL